MISIKGSRVSINFKEYQGISEFYAVDWVKELDIPAGAKGCVSYATPPKVKFKRSDATSGYATIGLAHTPQKILFSGLVENAWGDLDGKRQCDAVVCPSPDDKNSALLFIEFKHSTSTSNNTLSGYKKKAVKQFEDTRALLMAEGIAIGQRKLYALLWFPPIISEVSATLFSIDELDEIRRLKGITLYVGQGVRYTSDTNCRVLRSLDI